MQAEVAQNPKEPVVRRVIPRARDHSPLILRQPSSKATTSRLDACHGPTGLPVHPTGKEWPYSEWGRPYFDVSLSMWTVHQLETFLDIQGIPPGSITRFTRKAAAMLTLSPSHFAEWQITQGQADYTNDASLTSWQFDVPAPDELAKLLGHTGGGPGA